MMSHSTSAGVAAALTRVASQTSACARSRSPAGSQVVSVRVMLGNAPASPAPNRPRTRMSDVAPIAHPVAAVKIDHQMTMRISTLRGPIRSASQPPGISKMRVGVAEHRQRPTHLDAREAEVLGDEWRRLRNRDAIDVRDQRQHDAERDGDVAGTAAD